MTTLTRCEWVNLADPLYVHYHDTEWGVPLHDENGFFERICLETMQAGLSWLVVLRKRENFRAAFDNFDPQIVSRYDDAKIAELLANAGIVRNRLKINAIINNAGKFLDVQAQFGTFDRYLWDFVDGKPITNYNRTLADFQAETDISRKMSKDLQKRGFKFVGSTMCYAMMQATGMVNDHQVDCFRHAEIKALAGE